MSIRIVAAWVSLALAGSLAACTPGHYARWSSYRQKQADEDAYLSQRNAEAAQWQTQMGDYRGAQLSRDAANDEAARAQQERGHAARDRWLSQF
jgi:hypothetical protein